MAARRTAKEGGDMLRIFSYGGGVQSTAALVLAVQGKIDFKTFLFANVGDDSEHPATLRYVREVAMPYAAANGIRLEELTQLRQDGAQEAHGARFKRWTHLCHVCRNSDARARHQSRAALPPEEPVPLTAGNVTPVRYVLHRRGPCPSFDRQPREARHYYAAIARVAHEMGYPEQAQEWVTLAGRGR